MGVAGVVGRGPKGVAWTCAVCGEGWHTPEPMDVCPDCDVEQPDRACILLECGVPSRVANTEFHAPEKPTKPESGSWSDWSTVTLYGEPGTGKTMAGTELLWRLKRDGRSALFRHAGDAVADIVDRERAAEKRRLRRVGVLLIDDFGTRTEGWAINNLGELIEARISEGKQTIITTNLPMGQIKELRHRLWDRLRADLVVPMRGRSRR